MSRAMYSGVSGLESYNTGIDVIGNNVANINTPGYKANSTNFQDILSQTMQGASSPSPDGSLGGTNAVQIGLGVAVAGISTNFNDGNRQSTGIATNMAISGDGFFVLQNGNDYVYTRNGSFTKDASGNYVSAQGYKLMGYDSGSGQLKPIQVKIGTTMASSQSSAITATKNLNGDAAVGTLVSQTADVYDSLGTKHTLTTNYYKVSTTSAGTTMSGSSSWITYTSVNDPVAASSTSGQWQVVTFDATGKEQNVQSIKDNAPVFANTSDNETLTSLTLDPTASKTSTQTFMSVINGKPETFTLTFTADSSTTNKWSYTLGETGSTSTKTGTVNFTAASGYKFSDSSGATAATVALGSFTVDVSGLLNNPTKSKTPTTNGFSVSPVQTANIQSLLGPSNAIAAQPFKTTYSNGSSAMSITRDLTQLTQYGGMGNSSLAETADGYAAGTMQSASLDSTGTLVASYSNGQKQNISQVAMARFSNPEGLTKEGGSNYVVSNNSGTPEMGTANTGGRGAITGSSLEMSNVDLSQELTNMIIMERGFQSNSKIITTSDEMMQDLNNLKR